MAVAVPAVADTQFIPLEGIVAYTVTDLVPVVASLTVNVPPFVPLAVPVVPLHEYVEPLPLLEALNTTFVF
jgi:hypothetical protein